nr:hypothetical protein [Tanacetum cinerariifolium]
MVAYLEKSDDNIKFHQIVDFLSSCSINYALTVSLTIYVSYIEQFWNTVSSKTINYMKQIHAIVDGKAVVISKSSVRSDLLFDDEDGITCLANDDIFENFALMGYEPLFTKLTFQKDTSDSTRCQDTMGGISTQTRSERVLEQPNKPPLIEVHTSGSEGGRMEHIVELTNTVPPRPHDSHLTRGYTPGSDEGRLKLEELMDLYTTLSNRVSTLENELSSTKAVYHKSYEEEPSVHIKDSPKQGRMIKELDKYEDVNLVSQKGEVQETVEPSKDDDDATLAETLLNIKRTRQEQEKYNLEKALELQRQLDKREKYVEKGDQAKEIDWNDPTVLRYHVLHNRPFSKAE